jgi:tripartite-type tricarboxylate transporter receptor subunit TctC
MKLQCCQFLHLAAAAAAVVGLTVIVVTLSGHGALSQTARTIKIVVPFQPGAGSDILARLLGQQIGRAAGPTVVVENRAGAGSIVGTEAVSRAAPDGNTLLINTPTLIISPHLRKVNYDPLTSFEPICDLAHAPTVIVVNSASPYRTLADLLNAARAKPGGLTLAGSGPATTFHIAFEMLKRAAKVDMTFVAYPGSAPAVTALLGDHVTSMLTDYAGVAEQLKAGRLRALATASPTRIEGLADVPTVAESGYKDYEVDLWFGLVAPAKTPKETLSRLAGWFTAAIQVPEVKAKLAIQGLYPVGICGVDFGSYLRKQFDEYGRVIREANIKVE